MIKKVALKLLVFYKKYISRGSCCRFYPTCSEYAYKSVEKYGVIKGGWMGVKRVMKCNPFY